MLRTRVKLIPCIVSENSDLKLLVSRYYQLVSITEYLVKLQKHSELRHRMFDKNLFKLFWKMCKKSRLFASVTSPKIPAWKGVVGLGEWL